jgi:hypothetical protein
MAILTVMAVAIPVAVCRRPLCILLAGGALLSVR